MPDKCPICGRNMKTEREKFFTGDNKKYICCQKCGYVKGAEDARRYENSGRKGTQAFNKK